MISVGCNIGLTGVILPSLRKPSSDIILTRDQESWFGKCQQNNIIMNILSKLIVILLCSSIFDLRDTIYERYINNTSMSRHVFSLASMINFGSMIGTITCGVLTNYFGRKKTMMLANIFSISGFLFLRFANNVSLLYVSRILGGISFGLCFANIPPYTGEINHPRIRKFTGSLMPTLYNIGIVTTFALSTQFTWKTIVSIMLCFPCGVTVVLFFCPESPTWLMTKGKKKEAISNMEELRGNSELAMKEIETIENNLSKQKEVANTAHGDSVLKQKWNVLSKGTFIRPFIVVLVLLSLGWHCTGGPVLGFYIIDILKGFKIDELIDLYSCAVIISCCQLLFGLFATIIASKIPRRKLFMGCGTIVLTGTLIIGTTVYLNRQEYFIQYTKDYPALNWASFIGILVLYSGYFGGYVPVCFIFLSELLPSNARSIGSSMVTTFSILFLFILIKFAPTLISTEDGIGLDGSFWLFSGITSCTILFCYFFVPETFGKSLESIEDHYRKVCYGTKIVPSKCMNIGKEKDICNIDIVTKL